MRNIIAILRKEVLVSFTTPIAYVAYTVFTIISSFFFLRLLSDFQQRIQLYSQYNPQMLQYLNFTDHGLRPLFYNVAVILIFVVPFLTMRLIAEERRTKTIELLMTNPVTPIQISLGKYLGALTLLVPMLAIILLYPALVSLYAEVGSVAWGTVFTGLLGLFLVGAAFVAVGLFISSLTSSQVVAAAITFCALLMLWVIGWAGADNPGATREVLLSLSAIEHIRGFSDGVIDLKDVVYYISLAGLGFFLSQRALETQRWR
jgi:ABC-2 type transport system permease protein